MNTSNKFTDTPTERPFETARRISETGYTLIAFEAPMFGEPYRGVGILGPRPGFFPNLLGIGTEGVPLYVVKAAERLALEQFSPTTQLPDEEAAA